MYLSQPRDIITLSPGCSRRPASLHSYSAERERLSSSTSWVSDRSSIPSPASDSSAACFSFSPHQARAQEMQPITRSTIGVHGEPHALSLDRLKFDATAVPEPSRPRSRWMRSQHFQNVWDSLDPGTVDTRPPHPYTELIKLCILKRREGKLTLNQLYRDLEDKFAFFASSAKGKGWKVSLLPTCLFRRCCMHAPDTFSHLARRTRCATTCLRSRTLSSSTASTASWARATTGHTVRILRSRRRLRRAPWCSSRRSGLRRPRRRRRRSQMWRRVV